MPTGTPTPMQDGEDAGERRAEVDVPHLLPRHHHAARRQVAPPEGADRDAAHGQGKRLTKQSRHKYESTTFYSVNPPHRIERISKWSIRRQHVSCTNGWHSAACVWRVLKCPLVLSSSPDHSDEAAETGDLYFDARPIVLRITVRP